jgi:hypothetical protein
MSAFAQQWVGDPADLADFITPIAVDLYNGTGSEIRVSLQDFALRTEQGVRLSALSPFQLGGLSEREDPAALERGPLLASAGPLYAQVRVGPPPSMGSRGGSFSFGRGGGFVAPPPAMRFGGGYSGSYLGPRYGTGFGGGYAYRPRWGAGFYISGGYRSYYGPGARYWSGPWGYGYGYGPYVSYWGGASYPRGPSAEVLDMAIPDGVLAPGAHVNGFLYFQKATGPEVRSVTLTWTPVDVRSNQPVGEARIALEVARR